MVCPRLPARLPGVQNYRPFGDQCRAGLPRSDSSNSMAQIFHRSTNFLSRLSIFGAVFFVAILLWLFYDLEGVPLHDPADDRA